MLSRAKELIAKTASASNGSVTVGLSGGKDSLVILDLVCQSKLFERVEAYYLYVIKGLEWFDRPAIMTAQRHGIKLHFFPHPMLSKFLSSGECRMHINQKVPKIKQVDIEREIRKRTGIEWFILGHRKCDSLHRRGMLSACGNFDTKGRRCYPIGDWAPKDVHSYLRARKIPIPVPLIDNAKSNGFDLRPKTLIALRQKAPADYAKVLKVFPFADVTLFRTELENGIESPEISDESA